jgi:hypothetical protein
MWWARLLNVISGLLHDGSVAPTNSYESIQTVTVGSGGAASITFSSIPSTYKHLQIRGILKETVAQNWTTVNFNGDTTGSNYRAHQLNGNGSSVSASDTTLGLQYIVGTSEFGSYITDILDYANTSKYKTARNLGGVDQNGSGQLALSSALWMNTNAINQITINASSGVFVQYSTLALYGIKG